MLTGGPDYQDQDVRPYPRSKPIDDTRRPKSIRRVAFTRTNLALNSDEDFKEFLKIIADSDDRLSKIPNEKILYNWEKVYAKGLEIMFDVIWYDYVFFQLVDQSRRDTLDVGLSNDRVHSCAKRNMSMKADIDVVAKLGEEGLDG